MKITYVVTVSVQDSSKIEAWITWMLQVHIPNVKKTGMLLSGSGVIFAKEPLTHESKEHHFEVHYYFESKDVLDSYRATHGAALNIEYVEAGYGNTAPGKNDGAAPVISRHMLSIYSTVARVSTIDPVRDRKLKFLMQPIEDPIIYLDGTQAPELSVRVFNALYSARIDYWFKLLFIEEKELKRFRNFGDKSLDGVKDIFTKMQIHLDMKDGSRIMRSSWDKIYSASERCVDIHTFASSDAWKSFCEILMPTVLVGTITIHDFLGDDPRFSVRSSSDKTKKLYKSEVAQKQLEKILRDMCFLIKEHYFSRMKIFLEKVALD